MALKLKQHDRRPWLVAQLQNSDGTGIDISAAGVTVSVIVRSNASTTPAFKVACEKLTLGADIPDFYDDGTAVTDLNGWVRYKWAIGDTDTNGTFNVEWEILWAVNDPQTVPTEGYYQVVILDDLDSP